MEQTKQDNFLLLAVKGDKQAFAQLINSNSAFVYKLAYRLLLNEEDARDVVQDVFIKVWKNLKQYDSKVKFTTWLYKITTNRCLDILKSHERKFGKHKNIEEYGNITIEATDEYKNIEIKDLTEKMKRLTEKLTPKQKLVFVLHFIEEKNLDEIAEITGLGKGNIKSNLYYARKNMQHYVKSIISYSTI